ncbi:hypothetical protein V8G54_033265 [Vigna mungo]|uniref:Mitochondrial protein n=1 Tax=Vigna mungo TaxID=3915 RepID=A0AAQ3MN51_VIGMU
MSSCKSSPTPVDTKPKMNVATSPPFEDPSLYQSLVGALQYLTFTRPDITYVVQHVCLFMHDPREANMHALKHILRCIKGIIDLGLHLCPSSTSTLISYIDADWGGCPDTRCSTSGYCVFLRDNLISWSAKEYATLSLSSVVAKYRGVANVVSESLLHVPSRYQIADIFTKGLLLVLFEDFRDSLSIFRLPASRVGWQLHSITNKATSGRTSSLGKPKISSNTSIKLLAHKILVEKLDEPTRRRVAFLYHSEEERLSSWKVPSAKEVVERGIGNCMDEVVMSINNSQHRYEKTDDDSTSVDDEIREVSEDDEIEEI